MKTEHLSIMRHALGLSDQNERPYRNHYAYDPASSTGIAIKQMIAEGLMVHASDRTLDQERGLNNAHVTMEGLAALGFPAFSTLPGVAEINGAMVPTFEDAKL